MLRKLEAVLGYIGVSLLLWGLSGCADGGRGADQAGRPLFAAQEVTEDNFINGKSFCQLYSKVTNKEVGLRVEVPKDYNDPSKGTLEIYAYTLKKFDPSKPSYIYVDGGPGQNTHGYMPDYFNGEINEIRFDQRGLGCSIPETYKEYIDSSLYSTENTAKDMDEIRKAYGTDKWSIYGVSYGSIAATVYTSKFSKNVTSLVIEGVSGPGEDLYANQMRFRAQKFNDAMADFNDKQKEGFGKFIEEGSRDSVYILTLMFQATYEDKGFRTVKAILNALVSTDGKINRYIISTLMSKGVGSEPQYEHPQYPGSVDRNIMLIIGCKELSYRKNDLYDMNYSSTKGFYLSYIFGNKADKACNKLNVSFKDERPYKLSDYPVSNSIYYFQGSHDSATITDGALKHWQTVPQGKSYFLLAQKGGHNPNIARLERESTIVKFYQTELFLKTLEAKPITQDDLKDINQNMDSWRSWLLFTEPAKDSVKVKTEEEGILLMPSFVSNGN